MEERFLNKDYYNPEYVYNTEGPEILRLYNEKDNTTHYTFTDVLDSTYNGVTTPLPSISVPSTTTLCSSALSSTPSNQSGLSTTPTRRALSPQNSEESMLSEDELVKAVLRVGMERGSMQEVMSHALSCSFIYYIDCNGHFAKGRWKLWPNKISTKLNGNNN